ncbi:hypothetical protein ACQY0O_001429 [Thecaphora frezii]
MLQNLSLHALLRASLHALALLSPALARFATLVLARSYKSTANLSQASAAPTKLSAPSGTNTFINTTNSYYAKEMHKRWKQDPSSVHASWDVYFSSLAKGLPSEKAYCAPPTLMPIPMEVLPVGVSGFRSAELVNDHLKLQLRISSITIGMPH